MRFTSTKAPTVLVPFLDFGDAHQKDDNQAERENEGLTCVQNRERHIGANAHPLVTRHRFIVSRRFAVFGAKIFHRLEIEQAVDRLGVGLRVAFIHRAPDADAPIRGQSRKDQIRDHREADRGDIAPVERDQHGGDDQCELDRRRDGGQHRGADKGLDCVAPTLKNASESAGLALQMKAQRQVVQMLEHFDRQSAHCVHGDCREQAVTALLGERHQDAQDPVKSGQRRRSDQNTRQRDRIQGQLVGDRIGRPLVGIGNGDREQFREQHQRDGEKYAQLQIRAVGWPDVRP